MAATAALGLSACSDDALLQHIWIADPDDPFLPAYTEWGYNAFGCYIDGNPFTSANTYGRSIEVESNAAQTTLRLTGATDYFRSTDVNELAISFPLNSERDVEQLLDLQGKIFGLWDEGCTVTLTSTDTRDRKHVNNMKVEEGTIEFLRTQVVYVDNRKDNIILSGTFGMSGIVDGKRVRIEDGRFDVTVPME